MRIGILANVGSHFDAFWVEITGYLEEAGHEVFLAAGTPAKRLAVEIVPGITRRPGLSNLNSRRGLRDWVRRRNLDVVITNTATPSFLVRLFHPSVPVVYFAHGLHWTIEGSIGGVFWKRLERSLVQRTDGFITINNEDESWVKTNARSVPALRLPYGVGLDSSSFPRVPLEEGRNFVWIGEFIERKRPFEALKVMRLVSDQDPESRLFMLGQGPLRQEVMDRAAKDGLQDVIQFPGRVPPQAYLAGSIALLHTAAWEGLPRVALEALATGRPIIGYRIKGLSGLPGTVLASEGDLEGLASKMQNVAENPRPFAPDVAPSDLSWETCAMKLELFVRRVVSGAGS